MRKSRGLPQLLLAALRDRSGISAVEFALVTPLFGLVIAGAIDLGGALYTKSSLNTAISEGTEYAIVNAANATSANGGTLASTIASLVTSSQATNWANSSVIVNDGPTYTISGAGTGTMTSTSGGTASNANSCYCPTYSGSTMSWGSAATCGSTCADGSPAGKYVSVSASRTYTPFFPIYNLIQNDLISSSMVVQVQ